MVTKSITVIDNGSSCVDDLMTQIGRLGFEPARFRKEMLSELDASLLLDQSKGIIVSGGPGSVHDIDDWNLFQRSLIEQAYAKSIPVLGICFGMQLIAEVFGEERVVQAMDKPIKGVYPVDIVDSHPFLGDCHQLHTYKDHAEGIALRHSLGKLKVIASHNGIVEAFVGENLYGFQFHFEREDKGTNAGHILKHFLAQL